MPPSADLHTLLRAAEMCRQNVFPPNILLGQKPVARLRLTVAVACVGNAGRALSDSRFSSGKECLLNHGSSKLISASCFPAHSWLMAASIK
jgi:hypothetical protein